MAMVETPEAVENADAIAAVDGIDVLHIGASDPSDCYRYSIFVQNWWSRGGSNP